MWEHFIVNDLFKPMIELPQVVPLSGDLCLWNMVAAGPPPTYTFTSRLLWVCKLMRRPLSPLTHRHGRSANRRRSPARTESGRSLDGRRPPVGTVNHPLSDGRVSSVAGAHHPLPAARRSYVHALAGDHSTEYQSQLVITSCVGWTTHTCQVPVCNADKPTNNKIKYNVFSAIFRVVLLYITFF